MDAAGKQRSTIMERLARIRVNATRMSEHVATTEARDEDQASLRGQGLAKQKLSYLKAVAVAGPQQRPRRIAKALEKKGLLY